MIGENEHYLSREVGDVSINKRFDEQNWEEWECSPGHNAHQGRWLAKLFAPHVPPTFICRFVLWLYLYKDLLWYICVVIFLASKYLSKYRQGVFDMRILRKKLEYIQSFIRVSCSTLFHIILLLHSLLFYSCMKTRLILSMIHAIRLFRIYDTPKVLIKSFLHYKCMST